MTGYDPSEHYERWCRAQEDAHDAFRDIFTALDPPHSYSAGDVPEKTLQTAWAWLDEQRGKNPATGELVIEAGWLHAVLRDCNCAGRTYPGDSHEAGCRLKPLEEVAPLVKALRTAGYLVVEPAQSRESWVLGGELVEASVPEQTYASVTTHPVDTTRTGAYTPSVGDKVRAQYRLGGTWTDAIVVSENPPMLKVLSNGAVFRAEAYERIERREARA